MIIHQKEMQEVLTRLFRQHHFPAAKARSLARVHTENTLYGVNSHGINRVPRFIDYVQNGIVKVAAEAERVEQFGAVERWDGHLGSGVLNALRCTDRAVELARENGIGLVALRNTNHWMRGGYYGWRAADMGCISLLFTNTQPNMPAWGGRDSRIGNNPLVAGIPRDNGHVVLDMALSQFSFGKIHEYQLKGEQLPFPGGWDDEDQLSRNPEKILRKERGLPVGYWKGSALSLILDMLATLLSAGNSTYRIGKEPYETAISQVFLCIDPNIYPDKELREKLMNEIIQYTHEVDPMWEGGRTYYPGERSLKSKKDNLQNGMTVSDDVWNQVQALLK